MMKRTVFCLLFALCCCGLMAAGVYNVRDFGAKGSGMTLGLFARHVDGLHLQNVKFELMRPDERPDIILEDVTEY